MKGRGTVISNLVSYPHKANGPKNECLMVHASQTITNMVTVVQYSAFPFHLPLETSTNCKHIPFNYTTIHEQDVGHTTRTLI